MTMRTSTPSRLSAIGNAPTMSASTPVLANGAHSDATNRTLRGGAAIRGCLASVDTVIEMRKQIVARLEIVEKRLAHTRRVQVVVEPRELQDVLVDAPGG